MERDPSPLCHQLQKPLIAPVEGTGHEHFRSNLSVGRRIWPVQAASLGPNRSGAAPARIFDEPRHYRFSRDRHWPKPVDLSVGAMAALGRFETLPRLPTWHLAQVPPADFDIPVFGQL